MDTFQYILTDGNRGRKFIYFTVGTSYMVGSVPTYNVSGDDGLGNNYTATMTRGRRGEFLIQNLQQVGT